MSMEEINGKSADELGNELTALYREQFNLRMQRGSGQDVKPHNFKRVRRQIARIKTAMSATAASSNPTAGA